MLFRVIIVCLVLAGLYVSFEIGRFQWMYHSVRAVDADFQILEPEQPARITLVEFIDYNCPYCKQFNSAVHDFLNIRKDVRYIVRPIVVLQEGPSEKLTRIAFAAGLQGKFWEIHNAFMGNPEAVDDKFIRETASLYGLDYDQLMADSDSEEVAKIVAENAKTAENAGVFSTPTLFMDNTIIENMGRILTVQDLQRIAQGEQVDVSSQEETN